MQVLAVREIAGVDVRNSVEDRILEAAGLNNPHLDRVVIPHGEVLYGLPCFPDDAIRVHAALREAFRGTSFRVFLSHEGPSEWEWEWEWEKLAEYSLSIGNSSGRIAEIVTSSLGIDVESQLFPNLVETLRIGDSCVAEEPEDVVSFFFSRPPSWVCVVEARYSYYLPFMLQVPDAANWTGGRGDDSLRPLDHTLVLREWDSRYGVDVEYIGPKSLVLSLSSPPRAAPDIAWAAIEQFAYCPDLFQVYGDVEDVAKMQTGKGRWFFWWD